MTIQVKRSAVFAALTLSVLLSVPRESHADERRHHATFCQPFGYHDAESSSSTIDANCVYRHGSNLENRCTSHTLEVICPLTDTYNTNEGSAYLYVYDNHSTVEISANLIARSGDTSSAAWSSCTASNTTGTGYKLLTLTRCSADDVNTDWYSISVSLPVESSGAKSAIYGYRN